MDYENTKSVKSYFIAGILFASVLGTLSHFFYQWSAGNPVIALFSPVNESTWEHMKLVFFPVLLWSFFLPAGIRKSNPSLRPALLAGGLLGTWSIPVLFYTYSGILGKDVAFIDIAIFFIAVLISFGTAWKLGRSSGAGEFRLLIGVLSILMALAFFLFTFAPPQIGLFAEQL